MGEVSCPLELNGLRVREKILLGKNSTVRTRKGGMYVHYKPLTHIKILGENSASNRFRSPEQI